ncbi:serine hydrolase domain-containing protein [Chitinophaga lutea]|nr:serine hydrolase domain-containing protein [Chitinophaga lutea]
MKHQKGFFLLAGLIILSAYHTTSAQLKPDRAVRIDAVINKHIAARHIPGATALILRHGKVIYQQSFGYADMETRRAMRADDIFRIASQSKALTSLAVMMLWEEGKFLLDDPLSRYIPAFKAPKVLVSHNPADDSYTTRPASREITIRDLLRHTSGIAYAAVFSDPVMQRIYANAGIPSGIGTSTSTIREKMELLATLPLQHDPGAAFTYGLNTDLLGYLVEIWSGQPLDVFMRQRVFEPLEMKDTWFHLPAGKKDRLVSLYETTANGGLEKVNHQLYEGVDPLFPTLKGSYLSGGAGLSSTTADMANFYTMYLQKGQFKGKQLVAPSTVELILRNQLREGVHPSPLPQQPDDFAFTLGGFALTTAGNAYLQPRSIGSFGWGGAYNTHGWADPQKGLIVLLFTQEYLSPYFSIGEEFEAAVYQALP